MDEFFEFLKRHKTTLITTTITTGLAGLGARHYVKVLQREHEAERLTKMEQDWAKFAKIAASRAKEGGLKFPDLHWRLDRVSEDGVDRMLASHDGGVYVAERRDNKWSLGYQKLFRNPLITDASEEECTFRALEDASSEYYLVTHVDWERSSETLCARGPGFEVRVRKTPWPGDRSLGSSLETVAS